MEAANETTLARALETEGLVVLTVRLVTPESDQSLFGRTARVSRRQVLEATRALASLVAAGMPLARALSTAEHVVNGRLRNILADVRIQVELALRWRNIARGIPRVL
jgi:type II secretory pathway component PulF